MIEGVAGARPDSPAVPYPAGRKARPSAQPFVKWAGGKTNLLPELLRRVPAQFGTYFEPFVGGGALFFALSPPRAVLGDVNEDLICAYLEVRDDPSGLMDALDRYEYDPEVYYRVRAQSVAGLDLQARAARFLYLNRTCYNGLYRVNRRGEFNVPIGRYKRPLRLYDPAVLQAASAALAGAEIVLASFDRSVQHAKTGDFVYFDPPYWPVASTSSFTRYSPNGFDENDQKWLKALVDRLTERGVRVLLSNSDTPFTRWLYADYRIESVSAPRAINSDPANRGAVSELLVSNFSA
ncbi:MAG: site-specific DNA-methyltransferase (adenine-specific) [Dehalococcoidia bacterium]|nr:MAG: site-specific DNA-methyltransferase (adenine-specific) [Dehalococcoidia bacterium]